MLTFRSLVHSYNKVTVNFQRVHLRQLLVPLGLQ